MDASEVRIKIQTLRSEVQSAKHREETLTEKLKAAEALEEARQNTLKKLQRHIESREIDMDEQNDRLSKAQGKVGEALRRLDECEQEMRRLQAEELFRRGKMKHSGVRSKSGDVGETLQEKLQQADQCITERKAEIKDLTAKASDLEVITEETEDREEMLRRRSSQLSMEIGTLAEEVQRKERQQSSIIGAEQKLQERISKCANTIESERQRSRKATAEILRLDAILDQSIENSEVWKGEYTKAREALEMAEADLQNLLCE